MPLPDLVARLRLDDRQFAASATRTQQRIAGLESSAVGFGRKSVAATGAATGGFQKAAGAVSNLGVGFKLLAGSAALGVLNRVVHAASALEEQVSATSVTFGSAARSVLSFGEQTASSIAISNRAALEGANVMGAFFKQTGLADQEVADLSTTMVSLAGDLASFKDVKPEEALQALRSGLSGESEPLRRFGVFINEAKVEAEAYRSGIARSRLGAD